MIDDVAGTRPAPRNARQRCRLRVAAGVTGFLLLTVAGGLMLVLLTQVAVNNVQHPPSKQRDVGAQRTLAALTISDARRTYKSEGPLRPGLHPVYEVTVDPPERIPVKGYGSGVEVSLYVADGGTDVCALVRMDGYEDVALTDRLDKGDDTFDWQWRSKRPDRFAIATRG